MSGTSMDGVDASIIQSDGEKKYDVILDRYYEYSQGIYKDLTKLRDKIKSLKDLKKFSSELKNIERKITLFHAQIVNKILKKTKVNIDLIGFHGQTIYHNADKKISKQLGDGKLLSKLTKKIVVYNFRENDLKNGGQGAPLTPIFHQVLAKKFKLMPAYFLNIGGITNYTLVQNSVDKYFGLRANDIGPGMCLVDYWVRTNSKKKYDKNGKIAKLGKIDTLLIEIELEHEQRLFEKKLSKERISYDVKEFDSSFVKNLTFNDAVATLTEFTVYHLKASLNFVENNGEINLILCGGGRKNIFLKNRIKKFVSRCKLIDDYGIDGDYIESQAFAYLAIRSYLKLPISFPGTTGVKKPCTGGKIIKN